MSSLPTHHTESETLMAYAAGALEEAPSVLVATHLALCPECRRTLHEYEAIGGALIDQLEPAPVSPEALNTALGLLEAAELEPAQPPATAVDAETTRIVPRPLRDYLGGDLTALPWKSRGRGIKEASLLIGDGSMRASVYRIEPGERIPAHTHDGVETTLVLKGAFSDKTGRYARGDVAVATDELDHTPVSDASEECICFAVIDGSLKLTGPFGRILNLFVRL